MRLVLCKKVLGNRSIFSYFVSNDCVQYIHNAVEYKGEFNDSLKQNENEIRKLFEALENRYYEGLYKAQRQCSVNVKVISKLYGVINENQNKNNEKRNIIEEKNKQVSKQVSYHLPMHLKVI